VIEALSLLITLLAVGVAVGSLLRHPSQRR